MKLTVPFPVGRLRDCGPVTRKDWNQLNAILTVECRRMDRSLRIGCPGVQLGSRYT